MNSFPLTAFPSNHHLSLNNDYVLILLRNPHQIKEPRSGADYVIEAINDNVLFLRAPISTYKEKYRPLPRIYFNPGDDSFLIAATRRLTF